MRVLSLWLLLIGVVCCSLAGYQPNYLGCWKDAKHRALHVFRDFGSSNSVEKCRDHCASLRHKYSGNQYKTQCFCGADYQRHGKAPDHECSKVCPANPHENCGGTWRNSVYQSGYLGCFVDKSNRDLDGSFTDLGHSANRANCLKRCRLQRYKYAGLQYRSQCFCGDSYNKHHNERPKSECDAVCKGDRSQKCGGTWRNDIYQSGYLGCFEDKKSRDLSESFTDMGHSATIEKCISICHSKGYKYAGLQYSSQCFCGNSYNKYGHERPKAECDANCKGNKHQKCGGTWRNDVYRTGF